MEMHARKNEPKIFNENNAFDDNFFSTHIFVYAYQ